jgi:hypothetical protein
MWSGASMPCWPFGHVAAVTEDVYELVDAGPATRAIAETLPEAVGVAVIDFITGSSIDQPRRAGINSSPRPLASCTGSMTMSEPSRRSASTIEAPRTERPDVARLCDRRARGHVRKRTLAHVAVQR